MVCAACGHDLNGHASRRTFCSTKCRMRAYRRRRAAVPENALPAGARHGRLTLAASYEAALHAEAIADLRATRRALDRPSVYESRGLLVIGEEPRE